MCLRRYGIKADRVLVAFAYLVRHLPMHVEFTSHAGFSGRTMAVAVF